MNPVASMAPAVAAAALEAANLIFIATPTVTEQWDFTMTAMLSTNIYTDTVFVSSSNDRCSLQ